MLKKAILKALSFGMAFRLAHSILFGSRTVDSSSILFSGVHRFGEKLLVFTYQFGLGASCCKFINRYVYYIYAKMFMVEEEFGIFKKVHENVYSN